MDSSEVKREANDRSEVPWFVRIKIRDSGQGMLFVPLATKWRQRTRGVVENGWAGAVSVRGNATPGKI